MWPDLGRATSFALKSDPYAGVLARSTDGIVLEILQGEYEEVFPADLRKVWGQLSSSTRESFRQVGLVCQTLAERKLTLAAAWRLMEDQIDSLMEEGVENLRHAITVSALKRYNPRIDLDKDLVDDEGFLDCDALVSEIIVDAKAILAGEYRLPLKNTTVETTYKIFKKSVCPEGTGQVKSPRGQKLAEILLALVSAIASEDEKQRAKAVYDLFCYLLATRLARDYGHHTKAFRSTDHMEMDSFADSTSERLFPQVEARSDLEQLISQGSLSKGEHAVIRGLKEGLEGPALETRAKANGIKPSSVRQLKSRAMEKLRKAAG